MSVSSSPSERADTRLHSTVALGREERNGVGRVRNCHLVPYWPKNPYQTLLATHLRQLGWAIDTEGSLKHLIAVLKRHPGSVDVVHLHWLPGFAANSKVALRWVLFSLRLGRARQSGVKVVWTVHNLVPHETEWPRCDLWMGRRVGREADALIVHAQAAVPELQKALGPFPPQKIHVIPHGHYMDCYPNAVSVAEARDRLGLPAEAPVFLFLGGIRPYKGVFELIESIQALGRHDVRLVIAGKPLDSKTESQIKARVAGDPRMVLRCGFIPDDQLQCFFNAANLVVFPYRKSLSSGAVLLAMSFGRACVAPRLGGITDYLDAEGAVLYEASNPKGLDDALATALSLQTQWSAMGNHNLLRAQDWNWPRIARMTSDLYQSVLTT